MRSSWCCLPLLGFCLLDLSSPEVATIGSAVVFCRHRLYWGLVDRNSKKKRKKERLSSFFIFSPPVAQILLLDWPLLIRKPASDLKETLPPPSSCSRWRQSLQKSDSAPGSQRLASHRGRQSRLSAITHRCERSQLHNWTSRKHQF